METFVEGKQLLERVCGCCGFVIVIRGSVIRGILRPTSFDNFIYSDVESIEERVHGCWKGCSVLSLVRDNFDRSNVNDVSLREKQRGKREEEHKR